MRAAKGSESTVAVLMACYNRRDNTLAALTAVHTQEHRLPSSVQIYLLDDNSSDGTASAVQERFPQTRILKGDGNLYWNGGMRSAFQEAMKNDHDYYLWLNDDTHLYPTALDTLLCTASWVVGHDRESFVVVGSIKDPETGQHTYGGLVRCSRWHPLKFCPIPPTDVPQPCDTMNGNCVLVPRAVAQQVGNLSADFTHGGGDIDYGLRARRLGCSLWVAPDYLGVCPRNSREGTWLDPNLPLLDRIRKMIGAKGIPPAEMLVFARRHAGPLWPLFWLLPYRRILYGCNPWRTFQRRRQGRTNGFVDGQG